ncbi:GTP:AMP phosphotransferase AK3, mitochondrial-like isoform X1 [Haliotis rufescens]|uniref:GTP:AMP phosphotransferase AK3, mitochondrial-like isoform X1 n=2 Tax=Haliotis rufescens TaxID=6454 RepID=UPI00201EC874|nr:GTP:AMP phosphotransferase AK3, mitochondrial-like isoform X1 [Haliotis rufescens]
MISKLLRAIIMGPPGSGKGTISQRIMKDFDMKHLSSGDVLRKQIFERTAAGIEAEKYIAQGQLVPDLTMVNLIFNELEKLENHSWLLDGFPRTVAQAKEVLDRGPIDAVINLNVPFEVIIDRIKGRWTHPASGRIYHTEFNPPTKEGIDDVTGEPLIQRDDDRPETVRKRLEGYQLSTQPVLHFFNDKKLLKEFTGKYSNELWPLVHDYLATKTAPVQYTRYK